MCDDVLCCCVAVKKGRSGQVRLGQSKTIKVKNSAQPLVSVNSIAIACSAYVYVYVCGRKLSCSEAFTLLLYTPCSYNIAALLLCNKSEIFGSQSSHSDNNMNRTKPQMSTDS